jgi:hypothetical protein
MEPWTGAQRGFAVKALYINGNSFVIAQHKFRRDFGIRRNCAVPSAHAIKTWVRNFRGYWFYTKKERWLRKTRRTLAFRQPPE